MAQILAEEKQRSDTIAEGLEEESKKSLRMEEEMEKQSAAFDNERKTLKLTAAKEETRYFVSLANSNCIIIFKNCRVKELEQEVALLRAENEALKKQQQILQQSVAAGVSGTLVGGAKARTLSGERAR